MEALRDSTSEEHSREERFRVLAWVAYKSSRKDEVSPPRNEFNDEGYMYGLPGYWSDEGVVNLD